MSFIYLNQIECRLSQSQPCKAQSRKENPHLLIVWLELSACKRSKTGIKIFSGVTSAYPTQPLNLVFTMASSRKFYFLVALLSLLIIKVAGEEGELYSHFLRADIK